MRGDVLWMIFLQAAHVIDVCDDFRFAAHVHALLIAEKL